MAQNHQITLLLVGLVASIAAFQISAQPLDGLPDGDQLVKDLPGYRDHRAPRRWSACSSAVIASSMTCAAPSSVARSLGGLSAARRSR